MTIAPARTHALRIVAWGAGAVIAFDLAMSLASKMLRLPYGWGMVGSTVIYFAVGMLVTRSRDVQHPFRHVVAVAALVALVDASLGWAISWQVGPGRPDTPLTAVVWLWTALFVMIVAIVTALLGGVAGRLLPPRRRSGGGLPDGGADIPD